MLKGYIDAYRVFNDNHFLDIALKNASFLEENIIKNDGSLFRSYKNKKATINAYLEDYATLIEAYISLYEVSLEDKWVLLVGPIYLLVKLHIVKCKLLLGWHSLPNKH